MLDKSVHQDVVRFSNLVIAKRGALNLLTILRILRTLSRDI